MSVVKIETGIKVYDIADERGVVRGTVSFNPSDINFPIRAENFIKNVNELIEQAESIPEDLAEEEISKTIEDFDVKIKKEVDVLFDDDNASSVVFGNQNCLNTSKGITFIERFIEAFMPIIKKEIAEETKKSSERVKKYVKQVK